MDRNRKLALAFDCFAISACLGLALGCGLILAVILMLCGASALAVVAVLLVCAGLGGWCGVKVTRPARDLAAFG